MYFVAMLVVDLGRRKDFALCISQKPFTFQCKQFRSPSRLKKVTFCARRLIKSQIRCIFQEIFWESLRDKKPQSKTTGSAFPLDCTCSGKVREVAGILPVPFFSTKKVTHAQCHLVKDMLGKWEASNLQAKVQT